MALIFLLRPTSGDATSSVSSSLLTTVKTLGITGVVDRSPMSLRGEGSTRVAEGVASFSKPSEGGAGRTRGVARDFLRSSRCCGRRVSAVCIVPMMRWVDCSPDSSRPHCSPLRQALQKMHPRRWYHLHEQVPDNAVEGLDGLEDPCYQRLEMA